MNFEMSFDHLMCKGFAVDLNGKSTAIIDDEVYSGDWVVGYFTLCATNNGLRPAIITGTDKHCNLPRFVAPETVGRYCCVSEDDNEKVYEHDEILFLSKLHDRQAPMRGYIKFDEYSCSLKAVYEGEVFDIGYSIADVIIQRKVGSKFDVKEDTY